MVERIGECIQCGRPVYIILGNRQPFAISCSQNHRYGEYKSRRVARKEYEKQVKKNEENNQ